MTRTSDRYMKQYGDRNYAPKTRKLEKGDLAEYCNRSKSGKTSETGCCNSLLSSAQEQEEIRINHEESRKEDVSETHQEGRSGVQSSDQRRCEVEETDISQTKGKKMKKDVKEKKHEAKESKAQEKKEEKKESKSKKR